MKNPFKSPSKFTPDECVQHDLDGSDRSITFTRLYPNSPLISTFTIPSTTGTNQFIPAKLEIRNAVIRKDTTTRHLRLERVRWSIKPSEGAEVQHSSNRLRQKKRQERIFSSGKVKIKREETALKPNDMAHQTSTVIQLASPGALKKMSIMQNALISEGWTWSRTTATGNVVQEQGFPPPLCLVLELDMVEDVYDNRDFSLIDVEKGRMYGAAYNILMTISTTGETDIMAGEHEALPQYVPNIHGGLPSYEAVQEAAEVPS